MTARALKQLLAAVSVWAALGAPAAGGDTRAGDTRAGEWRSWCGDAGSVSSLGWHFYCDREEERQPDTSPALPPAIPPAGADTPSATERILELRRALEEARAEAILDPTPENVTAYLRLQQETLQRAAAFSDAFRRTVWATPELDYTLKRPVGALAKQIWSDGRRQARDAALARLGERYGLIYIGHAGCAACRVFGPLLRAFAMRHGLDVLAVSLTGEALEGWPEAVADNGRAARLGLGNAPVPALVLFDTATKRVLPVGFGVMAEDEMAERLFALTVLEPGHDY
ncbi:MAG: conjugal transfer protein TraF [Defluviicoccus sp.]|nr:conjugal transfer protein TraF [Defluviicoccus sp.]